MCDGVRAIHLPLGRGRTNVCADNLGHCEALGSSLTKGHAPIEQTGTTRPDRLVREVMVRAARHQRADPPAHRVADRRGHLGTRRAEQGWHHRGAGDVGRPDRCRRTAGRVTTARPGTATQVASAGGRGTRFPGPAGRDRSWGGPEAPR